MDPDEAWTSPIGSYLIAAVALRVIDRYRRVDFGHIEWALTIDDPKAFLKPWTQNVLQYVADLSFGVPAAAK